ncbi:hypothetical protein [Plantibacter sp. M259]|uniref:hypothetical protein n=1 Tax=Plantibacter sp. M259 TaxID=2583822 RepID=UPI0035172DCB
MPTQNTGTAIPSCERPDNAMPYQRSARSADTTPATGEHDGEEEREERQRHGDLEARRDLGSDRERAHERGTEVEGEDAAEPGGELLAERPVGSHLLARRVDLLLRGVHREQGVRVASSRSSTNSTVMATRNDTTRNADRRSR